MADGDGASAMVLGMNCIDVTIVFTVFAVKDGHESGSGHELEQEIKLWRDVMNDERLGNELWNECTMKRPKQSL